MNEFVLVLVAIVGGASGIIGVIIGGKISSAAADRTARIEERKHFRELGLKIAIINHERNAALAQQVANLKGLGAIVNAPPLEVFVIKGIRFMEIVATSNISADETARRLADLQVFTETVIDASKK
jgi:hypothetical protein